MNRESWQGVHGTSAYRMPRNPETLFKEADDHRFTLHHSSLALVEDSSVSAVQPPPAGYEAGYQVVLPYFGLFAYNAGRKRWLIDSNRLLFVSPGWEFRDEHPVEGLGHAAIIINPSVAILDEVCGTSGASRCEAFTEGSKPSTLSVLLLTQQMLHATAEASDGLAYDEWTIQALQAAIDAPKRESVRATRLVDRAKQFLHAHSFERICLEDAARAVGVSPVYLTQEFTRSEGVPLYRYQMRLRLGRALLELPHCDDITGLALDLGFSSHAHFSASFREIFGLTPSQYRTSIGTRRARSAILAGLKEDERARRKAA